MLTVDQIRRTVAAYFADKPVKKVWLFGSYARGGEDAQSDVDLLFSLKEDVKIGYYAVSQLAMDVEAKLETPVDLVEEETMFREVYRLVKPKLRLLYEAT